MVAAAMLADIASPLPLQGNVQNCALRYQRLADIVIVLSSKQPLIWYMS